MAFLHTIYIDDSGTHSGSSHAVAGAYVATVDQWREFIRNWDEVNQAENFGIFHMTDFIARQAQFKDWDDNKRRRVISKLINIINTRVTCGFAAGVSRSDYERVMPNDMKVRYGTNHYTFCVRQVLTSIREWREERGITEPMEYVFESGNGRGEIAKILNIFCSDERGISALGLIEDGFSFQPKKRVIPLQSADMLAHSIYRHVRSLTTLGQRYRTSGYLEGLVGKVNDARYCDEHSLSELVTLTREQESNGTLPPIR
jgi:Protein of unknown function (DUF3800)